MDRSAGEEHLIELKQRMTGYRGFFGVWLLCDTDNIFGLYPKFPIREKHAETGWYWLFVFFIGPETQPGFALEYLRHRL